MANTLNSSVSMTSTVDGARVSSNAPSITATPTSSNCIYSTMAVTSSAWTQVSLGSLTDVLQCYLYNDNTVYSQSLIQISGSGAGGSANPVGTILYPGYSTLLSWSGSLSGLWAKVVPNPQGAVYQLGQGSLQYILQQS